jgi:hypothetical protein
MTWRDLREFFWVLLAIVVLIWAALVAVLIVQSLLHVVAR